MKYSIYISFKVDTHTSTCTHTCTSVILYPLRSKLREGIISIRLFFTLIRKIKVNTNSITEHVPDIQTQGH